MNIRHVCTINPLDTLRQFIGEAADSLGRSMPMICQSALSRHALSANYLAERSTTQVHDITTAGITSLLLSTFIDLQLNLKYLIRQGYDGAAVTSGGGGGVQDKNY